MVLFQSIQAILSIIIILSSLGVIIARKPVHACLSFLLTLITLAAFYLELNAQFIGVMQVLVYAGAILVIFMFVIVLFQDAHQHIALYPSRSSRLLIFIAAAAFLATMLALSIRFITLTPIKNALPPDYGTVQSLGKTLYLDFFFPFEAVVLMFLIAVVGALYIGRKLK
jgi:NADH-quinone oxidoreductase subunit J